MKSCKEIKKVMEKGFDIFFTNMGIDENDGDDIMINKIENDFESKKKLIKDEKKFQEIKSELSKNKNEESIKNYFIKILETKDSTTLLALHSYYIETLKGYVDEFNTLQMGGAIFSQPKPTNKDPYGVVDTTDGVVVAKGETLKKLTVGAIFGIVGLSLLGIAIFSGGALAPAVGVGVFGGIFFIGGLIIRDKAEQNLIEEFQGLMKDEEGQEISRLRTTLPRNGLIRGALRTFTNHYNIRTTFSTLKEGVTNVPSAVTNFMSHTMASKGKSKGKTGNTQSGGEIDNLCNSIQEFMEKNDIPNKLKEFENTPEEQTEFEKLRARLNKQLGETDEAIEKAEVNLKQGGRRMRKLKGKSLKKRGGRKSIKKCVKKVVKKGGRKSVRKTLNKRGRKSVRR